MAAGGLIDFGQGEEWKAPEGGLLVLLQNIQATHGHIPESAIPHIARKMNLSTAEVHGVISFYHDLKTAPAGQHTLQVCRAESCQAAGGRALEAVAVAALGVPFGATTDDGKVSLEAVYCLGNCACSPSVRIDDETHARVDAARLQQLIQGLLGEGEA